MVLRARLGSDLKNISSLIDTSIRSLKSCFWYCSSWSSVAISLYLAWSSLITMGMFSISFIIFWGRYIHCVQKKNHHDLFKCQKSSSILLKLLLAFHAFALKSGSVKHTNSEGEKPCFCGRYTNMRTVWVICSTHHYCTKGNDQVRLGGPLTISLPCFTSSFLLYECRVNTFTPPGDSTWCYTEGSIAISAYLLVILLVFGLCFYPAIYCLLLPILSPSIGQGGF